MFDIYLTIQCADRCMVYGYCGDNGVCVVKPVNIFVMVLCFHWAIMMVLSRKSSRSWLSNTCGWECLWVYQTRNVSRILSILTCVGIIDKVASIFLTSSIKQIEQDDVTTGFPGVLSFSLMTKFEYDLDKPHSIEPIWERNKSWFEKQFNSNKSLTMFWELYLDYKVFSGFLVNLGVDQSPAALIVPGWILIDSCVTECDS